MFLFLDISGGEILVILVVVFLIFGPSKLPEMSRKIGKAMNDLKRASTDIRREIQQGASEVTRDFHDAKNKVVDDLSTLKTKTADNGADEKEKPEAAPTEKQDT